MIPSAALVDRVAGAAALSPAEAEATLGVVTGDLGICLTWGEAQNLADLLPEPYASQIRTRSLAPGGPRYSPTTFVVAVAEQLGVGPADAERRTRAVLETLRALLPPHRFQQLEEELTRFSRLLTPQQ